jgi:hypothetical protein
MTMTTHVAIGAAIGTFIDEPVLGFSLGLVSHFLVDIIPHGDSKMAERYADGNKKEKALAYFYGVLDYFAAIYLLLTLFNIGTFSSKTAFTAAIAGSILPDLIVVIYEGAKINALTWFHKMHFFFHDAISKRTGDLPLLAGLSYQVIAVMLIVNAII